MDMAVVREKHPQRFSSLYGAISQGRFLVFAFLLTEQRQNQALPRSSSNTKATQPGFSFVSEKLSKYPIIRDSHSIGKGGKMFPFDSHLFDPALSRRH